MTIVLSLAAAAVFGLVSYKKPQAGLGIILAVLPAYLIRFEILGIPSTFLELLLGVFLIVVAAANWNRQTLALINSLGAINVFAALFCLAGIVSTLIAPDQARALGQLKAFVVEPVLLFYASVVVVRRTQDYKQPLLWLLGSAALISVFGVVQYYTHVRLPLRFWGYGEEIKRITSVFEYPNALALYLAPIWALAAALYSQGLLRWKKLFIVASGFALAALYLTFSRGAWLALILAGAVWILSRARIRLSVLFGLGLIGLLLVSPLAVNRIKQTFTDRSSHDRIALLRVAGRELAEHPILGNGLGGFPQTLANSDYTGEPVNYPHNIILNFWLELGLLGIVSFAGAAVVLLKRFWRSQTALTASAGLALLVLLIHGLVDVPYFKNDLSVMFWFLAAMFYFEE